MKIKDIMKQVRLREQTMEGLACQQVQNSKNGYHDGEAIKKIVAAGKEFEDYLNKKVVIS